MILAITGGHGSGKTHLVAAITRRFDSIEFIPDPRGLTRAAVVSVGSSTQRSAKVAVIGQYFKEPHSGVDSGRFGGRVDELYEWMARYSFIGMDVLVEGMLLAGTWRRLLELHKLHDVNVFYIDEPLEVCLASIQERKNRRGATHNRSKLPLNEAVIAEKHRSIRSAVNAMRAEGMKVFWGRREEVTAEVLDMLSLTQASEEFRLI